MYGTQVFSTARGVNLAQGKPAFNHLTLWNTNSTADKAVDGSLASNSRSAPVCSIANANEPWWWVWLDRRAWCEKWD